MEESIVALVKAVVIKPNTALRLRASRGYTDRRGKSRLAGEEWLIRDSGSYLPDTYEVVVDVIKGTVLSDK